MSSGSPFGEQFRPVKRPSNAFESRGGGVDPAEVTRAAHESAAVLLGRARTSGDRSIGERMNTFVDADGIETLAELWSQAHPGTLPGALWRVYLLRSAIVQQAELTSLAFERGRQGSPGIDPVVAGAAAPTDPDEVRRVADEILRGVYAGDVAHAFERAAAFARVCSVGYVDLAQDAEPSEPEQASRFTVRADRLAHIAAELVNCARLWRAGSLD